MKWPPVKCPKCNRLWNTFPGAINYCNHMGVCPMPEKSAVTRDPLLVEREKTHGSWESNACAARAIINAIDRWNTQDIPTSQIMALHMIGLKIARALQHPSVKEHWDDIAGYAKLAGESCD
jgi:hypothetical protein